MFGINIDVLYSVDAGAIAASVLLFLLIILLLVLVLIVAVVSGVCVGPVSLIALGRHDHNKLH